MAIYKTAINKPITTGLVFVAVIVLGLFSLTRLPIDQMPEMDPPYVTVMTTYAGANASEIETNITKIIENSLNSVDGLKNITSTSKDNMSVVTLEFEWGENIDEALNDIRSYVDLLYDNLPDGVSRPMILKLNSSAMPILQFGFTAKESYPGLDRILEDNVTNVLNRVDGIGNITVSGAPQRYVYIDLDPKQLDAYGISLELVGNAISANNLDLASGTSVLYANDKNDVSDEVLDQLGNVMQTVRREDRRKANSGMVGGTTSGSSGKGTTTSGTKGNTSSGSKGVTPKGDKGSTPKGDKGNAVKPKN